MNAIRNIVIFAAAFMLVAATAWADTEVGTITGIDGPVLVDAFGTGEFLNAIPGESLYSKSVVKTEYGGTATIEVNGEITEMAPESTLLVENLLQSKERKKRFGWVRSIANTVKSVFKAAKSTSEDVVLGGRAAKAEESDVAWISEDVDEDTFYDAMEFVETGDWAGAVTLLQEVTDPLPGTFLPGELEYWKGYCQHQLENYNEAIIAYSNALTAIEVEPTDPWASPYYAEALFQFGYSAYLTGGFDDAVASMESLVPNVKYMILIDSLKETDDFSLAKRYVDEAVELFAGTEYAPAIEELANTLE